MAGMLFCGRQSHRNCLIAVCTRLRDLVALACFLPEDAVINALRLLVVRAAHLHVALQGGPTPPPLRLHGPFVVHVLQLQVVYLVGTALPEIQLCSFSLHCSLLHVFGFCPSRDAEWCMKSKCPSCLGNAT